MDRIYGGQRFIYDATRRPYLLGRAALIESLDPPAGGQVLEIGCGTAWNLIRAAKRYPDAQLHGLDVSSVMLETARGAIARAGLAGRITEEQAQATCFRPGELFGRATFDRVFLSYSLSMIPDWPSAATRAMDSLGRGGTLDILDFGQCDELPAAFRRLLFAWLARFSVTPIADLELELGRLAHARGFACRVAGSHRGYAVRAQLLHRA
jgi:S-adenosylmethionine-diacylgycerolhomoserine-N-methlytransferase